MYEKIQGLDGAFLRLEHQQICRVSNACIQRIPYKVRATFSDKHGLSNLLAYVIPIAICSTPSTTRTLEAVLHCRVHLCD